jgi:hypothetical protein
MSTLSVTHEAPLELVRQHPPLAVELLKAVTHLDLPDAADVRLGPASLNAVVPVEFRADAVVVVSDDAGRPAYVIVIEPQGRDDETKAYSWPAYLTLFLATLPAINMETDEGATRVLAAIRETGASASDRKTLTAIILKRASAAARKTLET